MARTVVGLFNSTAEARFALQQLRASGFAAGSLRLAISQSLQAQHLPAPHTIEQPSLSEGFAQLFTDIFAGSENSTDGNRAHVAAAHAESAVLTVAATTEDEANRARTLLAGNGAIDVYKQPQPVAPASAPTSGAIDLGGRLQRELNNDALDANGLTTH